MTFLTLAVTTAVGAVGGLCVAPAAGGTPPFPTASPLMILRGPCDDDDDILFQGGILFPRQQTPPPLEEPA